MAPAVPCKRMVHPSCTKVMQSNGNEKEFQAMYGCIVQSHESTRQRTESLQSKIHEDRIAGKRWKKLETIPAWNLERVKSKKEVILKAQRDQNKVHLASLMDRCHLKNAELEPKLRKYKGRVVLWEHIVKDDSGARAVFTEQGSSACQITAAKVMVVMARLPSWCSICLHSGKIGGCFHDLFGQQLKTPWYFLNETCTVIHLLGYCGKDSSRKFCWSLDGKKCWTGNVCSFIGNKGYFCQYRWMTCEWLERSNTWLLCGRNVWNMWILANPHHFLTMCTWDALSVNANRMKQSLDSVRRCLTQRRLRGPATWKDMLEHALSDTASWQTQKWSNKTKFQVLA